MDSLTQITLGAAMGELVLGRKIGNRAMVWGAIAGTIPDLDVMGQWWMSEIDALAFHRGVTHSILFAITIPWLLGWLSWTHYKRDGHQWVVVRYFMLILKLLFPLLLVIGAFFLSRQWTLPWTIMTLVGACGLAFFWARRILQRFSASTPVQVEATFTDWVSLFFWAIFTHPLLDAFTAYGTQLFYPFSDYRVAFNVIAVVDPIYTLPFLGAIIAASRIKRDEKLRRSLTQFGLVWSTAYLLLCSINKFYVERVFATSISKEGIEARRFSTSPTLFNNLLWQGIVETEDTFYLGTYSLLDPSPYVVDFLPISKSATLEETIGKQHVGQILEWFSNGYYTLSTLPNGRYRFYDLRFGGIMGPDEKPLEERFIFSFEIFQESSDWDARQIQPDRGEINKAFATLWQRIRGLPL